MTCVVLIPKQVTLIIWFFLVNQTNTTVLLDLWINDGYEHQTNEVNTDQMNYAFHQNQENIF